MSGLPTTETFVSHTSNALVKGTIAIQNSTLITVAAPKLSITLVQVILRGNTLTEQTIQLSKGWNIMSTNVCPADSSISTLFSELDVQEIKTMDSFWRKGQNTSFNRLKSLTAGVGYLVNMNIEGKLIISGKPISSGLKTTNTKGWQLIGCPFQSTTLFSSIFNSTNCSSIKTFNGFWIPQGTTNTITGFEPGKGYYLKKK